MPVPRDWSDPFLEQAREDLRAAYLVSAAVCPSTLCMLIQMVFEKLAKATFARQGQVVPMTHQAASRLFPLLLRYPQGQQLLTASPNVQAFVLALENAHPAVAGRLNPPAEQLEYPWEDATTGAILYPAHHLSIVKRVRDPKDRTVADCLKFASALAKEMPIMIP